MSRGASGTVRESANRLKRFQRVIAVGRETQKIVAALPALDIRKDG